jgi:hypothetical protein
VDLILRISGGGERAAMGINFSKQVAEVEHAARGAAANECRASVVNGSGAAATVGPVSGLGGGAHGVREGATMRRACFVFLAVLALAGTSLSATPVNVAKGTTATANSEYSPLFTANAVDGDRLTSWNAGDHGTVSDPNWLVVDLAQVFSVKNIDVIWAVNDGLYAGYTANYNVYSSLSGSVWSLLGSGVFVDETGVAPDYLISASWAFPSGLSMQYLKYEVDGGTHWSGVNEIEIYTDVVPDPGSSLLMLGLGLVGLSAWKKRLG